MLCGTYAFSGEMMKRCSLSQYPGFWREGLSSSGTRRHRYAFFWPGLSPGGFNPPIIEFCSLPVNGHVCVFSVFYVLCRVMCAPQAEETMRERVKKACEDLGNIDTLAKEV